MDTGTVPAGADALAILESVMAASAGTDPAGLPDAEKARRLRTLERIDAIQAAVRGRLLEAFDAQDGHLADGQRTTRTWLVHATRVTRRQAAEHKAVQALARSHPVLVTALAEGWVISKSVALQVTKWTRAIPGEYRDEAEEIVVTAARAGPDLRALAAICAEIRYRTAQPTRTTRTTSTWTGPCRSTQRWTASASSTATSPPSGAMVQAVLDALSAPTGGGDLRTRPQRYHDALAEAMRRLLASDLLPERAGQPVKALVHISFADLCQLDTDSVLQEQWIAGYRARWAAQRAAASVSPGDGGAWLDGDKARAVVSDAMIIPVVTGDIDPGAVEELIALCVRFHALRTQPCAPSTGPGTAAPDIQAPAANGDTPGPGTPDTAAVPAGLTGRAARQAEQAATVAGALAEMEHQILATILQVVSGPGGVASFLRRQLLGKPLAGHPYRWTSPRRASDRAQVRADAERAIVRYQEPPARFSAATTRKKAAHP